MPRTRQSDPLLTQTASEKFNLIDLIPKYDGSKSLGIRRLLEKINDVANLGSSESVQEFAARINKLGTQIFQSSNSSQNTAARNANDHFLQSRFISGLRNDIRRFVLARDPNNLEESINAALIEEQNVKLNQIANDERTGLSPLHTETSIISALTNKLDEINLRVERLQEASSITARKTQMNLSENFFCQNMYKDTTNFVRSCTVCLSGKNAFKIPPAPHQPVEPSQEPGETCHIDIFGILKTTPKDDLQPDDTEVKSIVPSPRYNLRARAGNSAD
ncbi:integrase_H2C2 domain-containing protein [Trichonephila clavipes]|uniref:Integrase_H2C2 domain-containing protein n=1 Tax=Trichonephila clavipes TaxID=2585209 RepID=A0A8X6S382_TRICX|nr:integrase_H2C2 domain-containing protein [Trichonephila clavipes]